MGGGFICQRGLNQSITQAIWRLHQSCLAGRGVKNKKKKTLPINRLFLNQEFANFVSVKSGDLSQSLGGKQWRLLGSHYTSKLIRKLAFSLSLWTWTWAKLCFIYLPWFGSARRRVSFVSILLEHRREVLINLSTEVISSREKGRAGFWWGGL